MNSLYLSNLPTNATQISTSSLPFVSAIFYPISGFGAQGKPINNISGIYLGNVSGQAPIVLNTGAPYTLNANNNAENLNKYFVTATSTVGTDGLYILYI